MRLPALALLLALVSTPAPLRAAPLEPRGPALQDRKEPTERDRKRDLLAAGDDARPEDLKALAAMRTEKALDALHDVVLELHAPYKVRNGYLNFLEFRGSAELLPEVIELLAKDALRHRRDVHRNGAANALAAIGEPAFGELEEVLRKSKEESVRSIVALPLVELLASRGDRKSLDLLFENVELTGRQRTRVADALRAGVEATENLEELVDQLGKRLEDRDTGAGVKSMLLDALAAAKTEEAIESIAECIDHESPEVALRAIQLLGGSNQQRFIPELEPLTRGDDNDAVVRAAIGALSDLRLDDPDWKRDVMRWSRDHRLGARLGACKALARYRDQEASDRLYGMLEDRAWQVRVETIQQLVSLRRKNSIPILIARLGVERGRLIDDVALGLRLLTAQDHGRRPKRWELWWEGEGEAFEVPSWEAVQKAEKERNERPEAMRSSVSFYGLQVTSDSVAFVIDISGSMSAEADGRRSRSPGEIGPTRLDVAKRELERSIQQLAEGVRFNIVLFGTMVRTWQEELIVMEDRVRAEATGFTREIDYGGGTNTYGGLIEALGDERVDTIYLLSDGAPSVGEVIRPDDIRERIRLLNGVRKVRIHTISIGIKSDFMRELAEDTGGRYIEVL